MSLMKVGQEVVDEFLSMLDDPWEARRVRESKTIRYREKITVLTHGGDEIDERWSAYVASWTHGKGSFPDCTTDGLG